jgi:5-methylcytosine-specific restriction enzyme subunit McrC
MTASARGALEPLYEYTPCPIPRSGLSEATGEYLYLEFKKQLTVEFPSPATDGDWRLTSQGYVGFIPLPDGRTLELKSKTPLGNLFHMLEYAFDIRPLPGLVEVATLDDFYERLVALLSTMVLERVRRGIYREYVRHEDRLPYVRGSIDMRRAATRPWDPFPHCRYQQHTPDIDENRILSWTLHTIARSGRIGYQSLPVVRKAFHAMESFALAQPFAGSDCVDRRYNRLNDDYERLHALCRFFLDSAGPQLESGGRSMVPFVINAAKLYEEFVAAWLTRNARDEYAVGVQVPVNYDGTPDMNSSIDLTLKTRGSDQVLCVLDTKYKVSADPEYSDMYQVTSYALTQGCHDAFLVYPEALRPAMDIRARPENDPFSDRAVRIRSLTFPVRDETSAADAELDTCGERFVRDLRRALAESAPAKSLAGAGTRSGLHD